MNYLMQQFAHLTNMDSDVYMVVSLVCLFGSYLVKETLGNTMLAFLIFPVLMFGALASILGAQGLRLLDFEDNLIPSVTVASCVGMSIALILLLILFKAAGKFET